MKALARFKRQVKKDLLRVLSYRPPHNAVEWAEEKRRLENGGRFRFDYAPYQREMVLAPFDPKVQLTGYMLASRLGKTEGMKTIIGHSIDEQPRRVLFMMPTISQMEKFSKETLEKELFETTPCLKYLVRGGRRNASNTMLHKIFPGGLINMFGANAPGEMRRAKGNLLLADEIDAIKGSKTDEGDELGIFWMRGSEYADAIKIAASYPSLWGHSRIASIMEQSDYRKYFTPCPRCSEPVIMLREHIRHPDGKPEKAVVECPKCSKSYSDQERRDSIHDGYWEATRPFTGVAGFWGNGMLSPHPVQKGFASHLHWIAQQQLEADKSSNPERERRVIVNTFDALPFKAKLEEKVEPWELVERREGYRPHLEVPDGVLVVTFGADVQGNRLELEFVGHGLNDETWGLGYKVIHGSPLKSSTWRDLDKLLLGTVFNHPSLGKLKAAAGCIDSKYRPDKVRSWTRQRKGRRIFSIYGSQILGKPPISKPKREGKPPVTLYEIGTNEIKDMIYQRLELMQDSGDTGFPQGYCHFPNTDEYEEAYFRGLTVEDSTLKKANDGDYYRAFDCPKGARNEPLDCRVYAMAAERILRPDYRAISRKAGSLDNAEEPKKPKTKKAKRAIARKRWVGGGY